MLVEERLCELAIAKQTGRHKALGVFVRLRIANTGKHCVHEYGDTHDQCFS